MPARLHRLIFPKRAAEAPNLFSYSFLKRWRECPQKVYLESGFYEELGGQRYPLFPNSRQLEGDLVHKLIEIVSNASRANSFASAEEALGCISLREIAREQLALLRQQLKLNPRVDPVILVGTIDVDRVINVAKEWIFSQLRFRPASTTASRGSSRSTEGSEIELKISSPPLFGKIDFVFDDEIIDFKTGEFDSSHVDQMQFYALLWKLRFDRLPQRATLLYARTRNSVAVTISPEATDKLQSIVRAQIEEILSSFAAKRFPARPERSTCRRCGVRQMCEQYWIEEPDESEPFGDVRVLFDASASVGPGFYQTSNKLFQIFIPAQLLPQEERPIRELRILNVRLDRTRHRADVLSTSEVFWQ